MKEKEMLMPTQIYDELRHRKRELEVLISAVEGNLKKAPEGILHTVSRYGGNSFEYYLKKEESRRESEKNRKDSGGNRRDRKQKETYIRQSEAAVIGGLAQKKYDLRILKAARRENEAINTFLKKIDRDALGEVFEKMIPGERTFIIPYIRDDSSYTARWLDVNYEGRGFHEDAPEYYTDKGERVRSKSEILIANKLTKLGIPYRYEFPRKIAGGVVVYPDFTILKVSTRQTIYWEHLGMLDDMEYVKYAVRKIEGYEASGIYPGKGLILTHETSKNPLSTKMIEGIIEEYLK